MRNVVISCFLLLILPFASRAFAQDEPQTQATNKAPETANASEPPAHYYHLDFVVQELDENRKPVNSRAYSYTVSTASHERDSVRIGSRVPIATGISGSSNEIVNTQFQYQNIGVNFDVSDVHEVGGKLAMNLGAEVTSIGPATHIGGPTSRVAPLTRQNSWRTPVLVPIGKSTVVFTSDDLDSKGGMQVMVTATLLH